ncbi:MAG: O-acetylhomoserine aminocarboxypropyltransferase/cysteine synthase [Fibromonadaceae bacterium]|jgi:O-acetylhomoserine (thiol)-lyase|nr:O-acetylhomoserine aminocarboxypropyltransferase/cysteine synthase [Fibromonadaceae bacterium]
MKKYRLETLAVHAGQETPDSVTTARAVPIYRTSTYVFKSAEHAANLFCLKELGNIYTRLTNPTTEVLENRITALEGGAASVALASGMSAIFYTIINLAQAGDEIVSAKNIYGGTYTQFDAILPTLGIKVKFVDQSEPENFEKAITPKTKAIYAETLGNPCLEIVDFKAIADIAHKHGLPFIVDSTFTTPYMFKAIEHGADIVVNSLTKWIGGQGTSIGGAITDAGTFNWGTGKHPLLSEPDNNYHGIRWAFDVPDSLKPIVFAVRARFVPLRNLGATISPDNAWQFLLGLETLPLRMARHCENNLKVAEWLSKHSKVAWVRYPGLPNDPSHELAKKYFKNGFGGTLTFGLKSGYEGAVKFIENVPLFSHVTNIGDTKSLVTHPASTTHSQLSKEQQLACGITPEFMRLSIGIEHIDDILEALEEGMEV